MALRRINWNDPLMKAIKAFNSITGNSLTEEDLKKQRSAMELAGKLAAPTGDVEIEPFKVGDISCEWIRPVLAHNPAYVTQMDKYSGIHTDCQVGDVIIYFSR